MTRRRKPSAQAIALLRCLSLRPLNWRYGYELTKEIGFQSGSLYPLLMRLKDEGLLESEWHAPARNGLPARHAYRLTQAGAAFARASLDAATSPTRGGGLAPA